MISVASELITNLFKSILKFLIMVSIMGISVRIIYAVFVPRPIRAMFKYIFKHVIKPSCLEINNIFRKAFGSKEEAPKNPKVIEFKGADDKRKRDRRRG